ncbi:MAG TPA: NAD(P)H-quinone oxidoreductase subunit D4, partial [Cyanobacteria bacterium UBA8543]|nr:NAD(P)H-quinone oxidoreductase subunit D4 [Cyanobacteria bacterium UBA8543]
MLSSLIWLPVLGAGIVGFLPKNIAATRLRPIAIAIATVILLVTLWIGSQFDLTNPGLQLQEYLPWI